MSGFSTGQVVIVTGAGRGIGRAHAITFAKAGASVVVNDLGTDYRGGGISSGPANEVVQEITAAGGRAVASGHDITSPAGAKAIIDTALNAFGDLTAVVNNAGILRNKPVFDMTLEDMNAVIGVHLMGPFNLTKEAALYWRSQTQAGKKLNASIVNTTSVAGLFPSPAFLGGKDISQTSAYAPAKAAVAAFTIATSLELKSFGIRVNAIAPGGRTRMNTDAIADLLGHELPDMRPPPGQFDAFAPENNSPLVLWLCSAEAKDVTGRVFETGGGRIGVSNGWTHGPADRRNGPHDPAELGAIVRKLLSEAPEAQGMMPPA